MIAKIQRAYTRYYSKNDNPTHFVEWIDHKGRRGRTEGRGPLEPGMHMHALFDRARREGVPIEREEW